MSDLQIEPEELRALVQTRTDVQLLDVREGWEWAIVHLEGATWIPMSELARRIDELDRERPLVVYCHHGVRSLHAALGLRSRGFTAARSLVGGIDRWATTIDSSLARY